MDNVDLGLWRLDADKPLRYERLTLPLERHLEDWLEKDGSLIQQELYIVGRQVRTDAGPMDLLGLDKFGRWAVIEIKRDQVRRETIVQAVDYAACLAEFDPPSLRKIVTEYMKKRNMSLKSFLDYLHLDENIFQLPHDIQVFVVGTEQDMRLDRLAKSVTFQGNPINIVTFDIFGNAAGERIMVRKLNADEVKTSPQESAPTENEISDIQNTFVADRHLALADENGIGEPFQLVYEAAMKYGLYPKRYAKSIMYAPQRNKNRVLFCVWVIPVRGKMRIWLASSAFAEFFPVRESDVIRILGRDRDLYVDVSETSEFTRKLDHLFKMIR